MGCRTGFYLLVAGDLSSKDIVPLMIEMFEFIRDYEGEVPGASPRDCGNYLDMNLGICLLYTSKAMVHTAKVVNGNILTGTKAPVILTSRSDSVEVKVNSLALGAVVAHSLQQK